ncbi:MAG: M48 family metallopeptidase [Acetobacteraceae bacterium]|nr:M48 family metallopeptidase [Acetobacteraceae bacterium]
MDVLEPEVVALPGGSARVAWRRSPRARRVSLRIDPRDGAVVVTLPPRAGRGAGIALLMTHAGWVRDRIAALPNPIRFESGAFVPICDVNHEIRHVPGQRGGAWLEAGAICVTGAPEFLARRVVDLLRLEARRRFATLVATKTARTTTGLKVRRIIVKDTSSRWGSCAPDGSLAFSWRLVMAPGFVQDYVVAHEVAHLRHMNHGKRFWALVDGLTPHRAMAIPWLRQEGARLLRIG